MVAPIGINPNTYSHVDNIRNMQNVGGQSQVTKKQDVEPQTAQSHVSDAVNLSDQVSFTQDAQENATHVGIAQVHSDEADEVEETRQDKSDISGLSGQNISAEDESGTTVKEGVTTDQNGFILLDENGNVTGSSGPNPADNSGNTVNNDGTTQAGDTNQEENVDPFARKQGESDADYANRMRDMITDPFVRKPGESDEDYANRMRVMSDPNRRMPGESETDYANRQKAATDDYNEAMKIWTQMQADRQKWLMELMKIISDARTATMEVFQSMIQNKAASMDRINHNWDRIFHER